VTGAVETILHGSYMTGLAQYRQDRQGVPGRIVRHHQLEPTESVLRTVTWPTSSPRKSTTNTPRTAT
jgi:hypothetical protein